jgi:hypothetical protein
MRNIYHHQQHQHHHHHHHHNTIDNLGLGEENDIATHYEHQFHNHNHHHQHSRNRQEPSEFLVENFSNATYQKNVLIDKNSEAINNGEFYKVNNSSKHNSKQQQIRSPKQIIRQFNPTNSSNVFPARKSTSTTNDDNDFNVNTEQKINDYIKFKPMNNKMQAPFSTTNYYNNNNQNSKLNYNLNNAQMSSSTTPPSSSTSPVSLSSSTNNILTTSEYHHSHNQYPYQYQQQRIIPFKQHKLSTASTISTSSSSSMSFLTNNTGSLNNYNSNEISNHFTLNQNGVEVSHVNYDEDHDNTIINENQQHTAIQMPIIQQQTAGCSTSRSSSSCSSYSSLGVALETHNQKINSANPPNQHRGSSLQIRNNIIQQQKNQQGKE